MDYNDLEYRKSKLLVALMKAIEEDKVIILPEFNNFRIKAVDSSWQILGPMSITGIHGKIRLPITINGINYEVSVASDAWINFCWKAWEQPNTKKHITGRKIKVLSQNEVIKKASLKKEIKVEKQITGIEKLKAQIKPENMELLLDKETKDTYILEKMIEWQNQDYKPDWEEFKNNWFFCGRCHSYQEGQCICYAR